MFSEQQTVRASLEILKWQYYKGHWKFTQLFRLYAGQAASWYTALHKKDVEQAAHWEKAKSYQGFRNKEMIT